MKIHNIYHVKYMGIQLQYIYGYTMEPSIILFSSSLIIVYSVTSNSSITGPYVAQNNSLILSNAVPSNSGIYTCYGIDSVSNRNLSISYNVTIYHQEGNPTCNNNIYSLYLSSWITN